MNLDVLDDARTERAHLRRQCMIGYALFNPDTPWNGDLYHRLHRARDGLAGAPAGTEVVLVHTTGTLYYQSCGDAIGRVMTAGGRTHHLPVQRSQRSQRLILQRQASRREEDRARAEASARRSLGRGHRHQAFLD